MSEKSRKKLSLKICMNLIWFKRLCFICVKWHRSVHTWWSNALDMWNVSVCVRVKSLKGSHRFSLLGPDPERLIYILIRVPCRDGVFEAHTRNTHTHNAPYIGSCYVTLYTIYTVWHSFIDDLWSISIVIKKTLCILCKALISCILFKVGPSLTINNQSRLIEINGTLEIKQPGSLETSSYCFWKPLMLLPKGFQ